MAPTQSTSNQGIPSLSDFRTALPLPGSRTLVVEIAGVRVQFTGLPNEIAQAGLAQYSRFLGNEPAEHKVRMLSGAPSYLPLAEDRYMSLETRVLPEGILLVSNHFAALRSETGGILLVGSPRDTTSVLGAIENYLRSLVAETVVRRSCVVLHSVGVVRGGKAYVFFGHSGAGKSTVAELSAPLPVLSDDLVLLQMTEDGWRACSTPFAGSYPQEKKADGSYSIEGLYLLCQAPETRIQRVPLPVAVGMLVSVAPFLTEQDRVHYAMPLLQNLCERVPVYEMRFRKDSSFWDVI